MVELSCPDHLIDFPKPPAKPAKASTPPALSSWSGERVDYLIALWAEGFGKTCPEIAAFLNEHTAGNRLTGMAVAGKIYRLDLPDKVRTLRDRQAQASREQKDRRIILKKKRKPLQVLIDSDIALCVPFAQLIDRRDNQWCRWVVGEPADLIFCGRERDGESPWCPHHHKRCTRPTR
jgi:hypothetical protein